VHLPARFLAIARVLLASAAPFFRWTDARRPSVRIAGLTVVVHPDSGTPNSFLPALQEALALLAAVAPNRLRRLRQDVLRILVEPWSGTAGYSRRSRAIILHPDHVGSCSTAWLAAGLVHESIHARLANSRIRTTIRNLSRIERRCCAEQIDFLTRLPASHAAEAERCVAWIQQCLTASEPWYDPARRFRELVRSVSDRSSRPQKAARVKKDRAPDV